MNLRLLPLLALPLALALGACSEGVDPTVGTDEVFTLYGYLDPTADRQSIRVVPIAERLDAETPDAIDAAVTATDLASGETVAFRDSLVTFPDGARGFVFVADWTPGFGRTYRVEAVRAEDGKAASAVVETPEAVNATLAPPISTLDDLVYPVLFGQAPNVFATEILISARESAASDTTVYRIPYPEGRSEVGPDGTVVEIPFVSIVRDFLIDRGLFAQLELLELELRAFVANDEWDVPSGRFDDDDEIVLEVDCRTPGAGESTCPVGASMVGFVDEAG
jgi:hypothetical protein